MPQYFAVIMAGGRGERFWPQSSPERPKHLLSIVGEEPMVTQTVARLEGLVPPERVFILTNVQHVAAVQAACPTVPKQQVIGEPMGRDTGPAAALAALLVRQRDPEGVLVLLPADAAIHDAAGYRATLRAALAVAGQRDEIITIGIKPTHPATGYGYLRRGPLLGESEGRPWFRVERFVEKPDLATAKRYLEEGCYLWNAGIFVARAVVLEAAFRAHAPALADGMGRIAQALNNRSDDETLLAQVLGQYYAGLPKISVDFAVMEKAANMAAFEAGFDWDDVGEWPALARHWPLDHDGNVARGPVVLEDSRNNIVIGESGHVVALMGVDDLVVVQAGKATLVCHKDSAQDLKKLLQKISQAPASSPVI
jgi:mannose-1-phosphate guanylyltransferase